MLNTEGAEVTPTGAATAHLQARGIRDFYHYRAASVVGVVYVAREDWDDLRAAVLAGRFSQPITLGFYLGGNGNTVLVPAWTLDHAAISRARAVAKWPRWARRLLQKVIR